MLTDRQRDRRNVTSLVEVSTRICAAEMAVRYAALSACRKVRMPSARAEKYMCVIVIRYVVRRDAR